MIVYGYWYFVLEHCMTCSFRILCTAGAAVKVMWLQNSGYWWWWKWCEDDTASRYRCWNQRERRIASSKGSGLQCWEYVCFAVLFVTFSSLPKDWLWFGFQSPDPPCINFFPSSGAWCLLPQHLFERLQAYNDFLRASLFIAFVFVYLLVRKHITT